jgi:shikimate kinase
MNITLIGFMGTGKTVVGRRLAKRLKRRFVDVDQLIERREHATIADIFAQRGERYFRRIERAVIAQVSKQSRVVIATGGGAPLDPMNMRRLKHAGPVICLSASVAVILERVSRRRHRPLLASAIGEIKRQRVAALLKKRRTAYEQADWTINVSRRSTMQVVCAIETQLRTLAHSTSRQTRCDLPRLLCKHAQASHKQYAGQFIAIVDDTVIAVGSSRRAVYTQATHNVPQTKSVGIVYVPRRHELAHVSP